MHRLSTLVLGLIFFSAGSIEQSLAGKLRASCVKVDITPAKPVLMQAYPRPGPSEGVLDRIYHRVVALDDGETQVFLISSDLAIVRYDVYREFSQRLARETGIRPEQVWWNTTQTHSGPQVGLEPEDSGTFKANPDYSAWLKRALIDAIVEARKKLEPARLGVATGMSMANINRRPREIDGSVPYVGLNPEGPVDRQIGLIRLERADGSLLALIASYAMHGTVLPVNGPEFLLISGDAQGVVAEYVEEKTGAPLLLMSGAEGDVAPIYSTITMPHAKNQGLNHLSQFKVLLGDRILAANRSVAATATEVRLWTGRTMIETPLKEKQTVWYQEAMRGLKRETDDGVTLVRIPVDFLKINREILLWAAPLELFGEIAMKVRDRSPFPYTFFYGLNNGYLGYLTTRKAFAEGGFEPRISPYTEQAEEDLTSGVLNAVWALPGRR